MLLAGACAADPPAPVAIPERFVLLPNPDGKATAITVTGASGTTATLSEPYAEAVVSSAGIAVGKTDAAAVARRFGDVLAATPAPPRKFIVYFTLGGDELTAESRRVLGTILQELRGVAAAEVLVIGHTDRIGTLEANDALSRKRAQLIRERLIEIGVPAARIVTSGRGEREPLVATEDEVAEARNRRVEVTVR